MDMPAYNSRGALTTMDEEVAKVSKPVVKAYLWQNGNVMAFDADGRQVPAYQGDDALEKLRRDYPDLKVEGAIWPRGE